MEISKKLVRDVNRIVNESKGSEVEKFRRRYEKYSVEELKKEKAELEKEIENSEAGGYEYDSLEWQIDTIDMFIKERKKAKVNEKWDMVDVAKPQGNIPTNPQDEFYRREAADMSLTYGATRKPVRNKKEFVEAVADKSDVEPKYVYNKIKELEKKSRPGRRYEIDIDELLDYLRQLKAGH